MNWYKRAAKPTPVAMIGTLRANGDYVYLDVDGRIIAPFLQMLDADAKHPKTVTDDDKDVGAHISVMDSDEAEGKKIKEIGEEFRFFIDGVHSVKPQGWEEVSKVYFITVSSIELEKLRENYGLSKKLNGHDFHITVGVESA